MKKLILTIIFFVIETFKIRKINPANVKMNKNQVFQYSEELMKSKIASRKLKIKKYKNSK
tara:strand:- start:599 stop:778 length:180 start_codon:yes stop_codon:yes gene_type:complete